MDRTTFEIRLERTPEGRRPRVYEISLTADLFGAPLLVRAWGGVGRTGGRALLESYPTMAAARLAASRWLRAKRRRGYRKAAKRRGPL